MIASQERRDSDRQVAKRHVVVPWVAARRFDDQSRRANRADRHQRELPESHEGRHLCELVDADVPRGKHRDSVDAVNRMVSNSVLTENDVVEKPATHDDGDIVRQLVSETDKSLLHAPILSAERYAPVP